IKTPLPPSWSRAEQRRAPLVSVPGGLRACVHERERDRERERERERASSCRPRSLMISAEIINQRGLPSKWASPFFFLLVLVSEPDKTTLHGLSQLLPSFFLAC
uniref:Uncharacterized protein n=1 Tax=Aegilops tauschii subsp. strangulata TaxID=200361 RepID=A0A453SDC8_AEGTS